MFNDRDLGILGAGALGAILCLRLPWSFGAKVTVAILILVIFMALALVRLGGDRLNLEQYLKRQLVFAFQPRRYSYFPKAAKSNVSSAKPSAESTRPMISPIAFKLDDTGLYWLMTVWLVVIGAHVVYWAYFLGGTKDAAFWVEKIFR
jgi:hypothetical protein